MQLEHSRAARSHGAPPRKTSREQGSFAGGQKRTEPSEAACGALLRTGRRNREAPFRAAPGEGPQKASGKMHPESWRTGGHSGGGSFSAATGNVDGLLERRRRARRSLHPCISLLTPCRGPDWEARETSAPRTVPAVGRHLAHRRLPAPAPLLPTPLWLAPNPLGSGREETLLPLIEFLSAALPSSPCAARGVPSKALTGPPRACPDR